MYPLVFRTLPMVHQTKQLKQKHHTTKREKKTFKTLNIYFYLFFILFFFSLYK